MRCVVTAGPTYEPLDAVRRLTNFSTGRLGSELADHLAAHGHDVTLLLGELATYRGEPKAPAIEQFNTTANLAAQLERLSHGQVDAVFHAAAVGDFGFGKVWSRSHKGEMTEVKSSKISTQSESTLLAELRPTVKIIGSLRQWFPKSVLVGWKFELDGDRASVLALAERQIAQCRTNACVANGRAYGPGFGLVTAPGQCRHLADAAALYAALENLLHH